MASRRSCATRRGVSPEQEEHGGGRRRRRRRSRSTIASAIQSSAESSTAANYNDPILMTHTITLIPGDGIGPEVTHGGSSDPRGDRRLDRLGDPGTPASWPSSKPASPLPDALIDSIRRNKVALKGPVTTPIGEGFTSVNVGLRKALDLYANLRPVWNLPGVAVAVLGRRPRHRPREHRGPVRGPRARGHSRRRREPEDHHRARVDAHRAVRLRARAAPRAQEGDGDPQGEHHEAQRRAVPRMRSARVAREFPTSPTTRRSSTPRACTS